MPLLSNQWTALNYKDADRQRIYLKDIDCPPLWHDHLKRQIPPPLYYFNESPEVFEGPGSASDPYSNEHGTSESPEIKIAKAGDLMSCLPPSMRAENLMCYIGHEGTYTPSHQEMCANLGHNIMVEASDGSVEYGQQTTPGSSIWFMTESKDRHVVSEYWMSTLGHDIDIEDHFAQINAWKAAPFKTYIVEQRPGDLILIPPLAAHQVWNRGTRTMKVAWNRTTVETLEKALNEALPHARMVCRDEQYKNKAIVFYSLERYSKLLGYVDETNKNNLEIQELLESFQHLFTLYTQILLSENFSQDAGDVEFIPFDSNITCSYCRGNIFNRFLTCPSCAGSPEGEDAYDICMECFVMGRSCACISNLKWVEQFPWDELTERYETWRMQILSFSSDLSGYYLPFSEERARMGKKTLAEICQEQLAMRPWVDITKPAAQRVEKMHDSDISDSDNVGPARKRRKTRRRDMLQGTGHCHICKCPEPVWKLVSCSSCKLNYCYGSLFRAFTIQPQDAMEKYKWECPRCQKICSCAACRRDPTITPFEPTCTVLGYDTKKIADPRSVESLVDFRHSNLKWLKKVGADDAARLKNRQKQADEERNQTMIDYSIQLEETPPESNYSTEFGDIPVDPALEQLDNSFLTSPEL